MQFIRDLNNLKYFKFGCALTIGNFDGFHLGHKVLINKLKLEAQYYNLPTMVMIFEPQPNEYFSNFKSSSRLTLLRDKVKYLRLSGVDFLLCINFNAKFSSLSAISFIRDLLIKKLKVRLIVIGDDFHFGAGRKGDYLLLHKISKELGFKLISILPYIKNNQRVSSTNIRNILSKDNFKKAEILLGHPYSISGRVVYGNSIGRRLGFPTANILFRKIKIPINGVYLVKVSGVIAKPLLGIANIGIKPTLLRKDKQQQLEVHLLDINLNLYGLHIEVTVIKKIRDEKCFSSLNELKKQITNDIIIVRNLLKKDKNLLNNEIRNNNDKL